MYILSSLYCNETMAITYMLFQIHNSNGSRNDQTGKKEKKNTQLLAETTRRNERDYGTAGSDLQCVVLTGEDEKKN